MNRAISIAILIIAFCQCERDTRLLDNITVTGKVIHFFTKKPIAGQAVHLYSEQFHSNQGDPTLVGETTTDSEGNFSIKGRESRKNSYYLYYGGNCSSMGDTAFYSKKNINIGSLLSGRKTFVYRVHLIPTSFNCIWVPDSVGNMVKITAGTDTYRIYKKDISFCDVKSGRSFSLSFRKDACVNTDLNPNNNIKVGAYSSDTLTLDINY